MDRVSDPIDQGGRRPERGPVAELARLFLVQLAAVIGIAAAIVVVVALVGPDDDVTTATPAASGTASASTTPEPATTSSSSKAPKPSGTSAPASSSEPVPSESTTVAGGVAAPVKVDVLNQSAPGGSAEQVAQRLEDAGWEIGRVDDFHGNVSTTTVYWLDPEQRRQARQVSRFLGGVRVLEGFSTLVDDRVSVVLVDSP
jgi:hypothetical protein